MADAHLSVHLFPASKQSSRRGALSCRRSSQLDHAAGRRQLAATGSDSRASVGQGRGPQPPLLAAPLISDYRATKYQMDVPIWGMDDIAEGMGNLHLQSEKTKIGSE